MGRVRGRLVPSLLKVGERLVPHLAPEGMVGQPLDLLSDLITTE